MHFTGQLDSALIGRHLRVTLRRRLVDTGLLLRDAAGSTYWTLRRVPGADLDPAKVLAAIREERAERKRKHAP